MKLIQWSYTKRYQVKAIFDEFPNMILVFRTIGSYYFIFTTKGSIDNRYPTRKDYVEMELLVNEQLQTLQSYINRKSPLEMKWVDEWLQKKELPLTQLEVLSHKE
ncbi:hypothetical protein MHH33_09925 [Paenisporosarcina sp. FSL H8-0542]|uniref:hypothetical protein n=1 Tax=Paenisporosarcina sp. FSL H8-0542 TaxID=2921401 RepID=UPI00034E65AB|nr:hypothetical protein [Paenisporosarcina sp. HGH0030]EPD53963.1 hypothetical protein HMPREF1210_00786 [Paenisporosarcina sp. HGH0030]